MTIKKVIKVIACMMLICMTFTSVAIAETVEQEPVAEQKTMVWQTIKFYNGEKITVIFEYPDPMNLGDEISFYCEYYNCEEDDFKYTWQYSADCMWWTNFGSHSRLDTTYCDMLAGKYIRLEVERID